MSYFYIYIMPTFADKAIRFNKALNYNGADLPSGIRIMNPFKESSQALELTKIFYKKYYNDQHQRHLILGINPGRFGAGLTGIPFTDPKRLVNVCNIPYAGKVTHEPSSVFIYDMITAYGSPELFYKDFYINSPFPLAFISSNVQGKETNYNYYDNKALLHAVSGFIIENIRTLISMGINTDLCFCLGTGKNEQFLRKLNAEYSFFKKLVPLEHPRYIMQYKSAQKQFYINKYIQAFKEITK
jgi:hypothetical protein